MRRGLCAAHTEFETRLSTAEATARQRGINYAYFEFPDYKGGKRVGKAAGHLGRCLSLASVAEGSANLPLASQLYADFLTQLPKFADPAVAAVPFRASPIQCAELLERVCCYALCVTAQAAAREPAWLAPAPALVAALPVDGRWKVNVEQLKPTMRHLRAALNAVRPGAPRRQPADAHADGLLARQRRVGSGGGGARGDRAARAADEPAALA